MHAVADELKNHDMKIWKKGLYESSEKLYLVFSSKSFPPSINWQYLNYLEYVGREFKNNNLTIKLILLKILKSQLYLFFIIYQIQIICEKTPICK